MIAVENVGTQVKRKLRLGRVRLGVADSPGSKQLVDFARMTVEPGSLIRTDGARMFRVLASQGYQHEYLSGYSSPEPGHVTLPGPHRVASLLKRWNAGTHHYRVERETCPTTSTNSHFGSIAAGQQLAACSSTGSCNKASTPTHTHCMSSLSGVRTPHPLITTNQRLCLATPLANSRNIVHLSR